MSANAVLQSWRQEARNRVTSPDHHRRAEESVGERGDIMEPTTEIKPTQGAKTSLLLSLADFLFSDLHDRGGTQHVTHSRQ